MLAVIEDLHRAGAATFDFLAYEGRRIELSSSVLIVTYRDDLRHDHRLRAVSGDLATVAALRRLRLEPLSASAVAALAASTEWDRRRSLSTT